MITVKQSIEVAGANLLATLAPPMLTGLHRVLDNPLGVPCLIGAVPSFQKKAREGMFDTHSLRESMLALAALAKWRSNRWARGAASRMIAGLERLIRSDCTWDVDPMTDGLLPNSEKVAVDGLESTDPVKLTYSHGRLIEALLELCVPPHHGTGPGKRLRLYPGVRGGEELR